MHLIKGLNLNDKKRQQHINELRKIMGDHEHFSVFCFLYENLSIIDGKSASLLQFNSILIAVLALVIKMDAVFQSTLIIMFLASSILSLYTVYIHWSTSDDFKSLEEHISVLLKIREKRTIIYRISWWLSAIGLISFIIYNVVIVFVGR